MLQRVLGLAIFLGSASIGERTWMALYFLVSLVGPMLTVYGFGVFRRPVRHQPAAARPILC